MGLELSNEEQLRASAESAIQMLFSFLVDNEIYVVYVLGLMFCFWFVFRILNVFGMRLPVVSDNELDVSIKDLLIDKQLQSNLNKGGRLAQKTINEYPDPAFGHEDDPILIQPFDAWFEGKYYKYFVVDGVHRAIRAIRRGETEMRAILR